MDLLSGSLTAVQKLANFFSHANFVFVTVGRYGDAEGLRRADGSRRGGRGREEELQELFLEEGCGVPVVSVAPAWCAASRCGPPCPPASASLPLPMPLGMARAGRG
jgi:hypothetical protein